jgi:hypothetical protein
LPKALPAVKDKVGTAIALLFSSRLSLMVKDGLLTSLTEKPE